MRAWLARGLVLGLWTLCVLLLTQSGCNSSIPQGNDVPIGNPGSGDDVITGDADVPTSGDTASESPGGLSTDGSGSAGASGEPSGSPVPAPTSAPSPTDTDDSPVLDDGETDEDPTEPPVDDDINGEIQSGTLTAGAFDDSLNPDVFANFITTTRQESLGQALPAILPANSVVIEVLGADDIPAGNARLEIVPMDQGASGEPNEAISIPTGPDGRALIAPAMYGWDDALTFVVSVYVGDDGIATSREILNVADRDWFIQLVNRNGVLPSTIDLALVIDTTGSMGDELAYLQVEFDAIVTAVAEEFPAVSQRYALIFYRDEGDAYVVRATDFTSDLQAAQTDLALQTASGGGDYPEAMDAAMESAAELSWSPGDAARLVFLVADAPPHILGYEPMLDAVETLRDEGVRIHSVAASGVATEAEYLMRTACWMTLGEYVFLTDDSGVGNSHAEPSIPCYHVQRLDHVILRLVREALAGEQLEPSSEQIIRTVGNPVNGVCMDEETDPQQQ